MDGGCGLWGGQDADSEGLLVLLGTWVCNYVVCGFVVSSPYVDALIERVRVMSNTRGDHYNHVRLQSVLLNEAEDLVSWHSNPEVTSSTLTKTGGC